MHNNKDAIKKVALVTVLAVNLDEAARMLSVSRRTVENFVRAKRLPARKLGRRTVISVRALETFLRSDHPSPLAQGEASADVTPEVE